MRASTLLEMPPRRKLPEKLPPPRPGRGFSAASFAQQWDKFLRRHPEVTSAELVDRMRKKALRWNEKAREWQPLTGAMMYLWRKGTHEPGSSDLAGLADVLECTAEDLLD